MCRVTDASLSLGGYPVKLMICLSPSGVAGFGGDGFWPIRCGHGADLTSARGQRLAGKVPRDNDDRSELPHRAGERQKSACRYRRAQRGQHDLAERGPNSPLHARRCAAHAEGRAALLQRGYFHGDQPVPRSPAAGTTARRWFGIGATAGGGHNSRFNAISRANASSSVSSPGFNWRWRSYRSSS